MTPEEARIFQMQYGVQIPTPVANVASTSAAPQPRYRRYYASLNQAIELEDREVRRNSIDERDEANGVEADNRGGA